MTNPYLQGNFAPVTDETTAFDLAVSGSLPPELTGRYLRIGPNPVDAPDPTTYHWFTGAGMVHGVRLDHGRAEWYRNRTVHAPTSVNTNVIGHAGQTLAIVEAGGQPVALTDELETLASTDFAGTLPGSFTAHPKRDPHTGELHAVVYSWMWDYIQYVVVGVDGLVRRTVDIPVPGKPMVHDCAITATQVVLLDLPCHFDLDRAMHGEPFPYVWNDSHAARVGLLPRDGAANDVRWCELDDPCFVFHPLNAYDESDGTVVLDVVRHPAMFKTDFLGPNEGPTRLERWTVDPAGGKVRTDVLSDISQEFPRVDERVVGTRHRYGYGAAFVPDPGGGVRLGSLLKTDVGHGRTDVHDAGPGMFAMEPVFVPRAPDAAEDDGWVLAYVHNTERNACDVLVLDAQDFMGAPVATVHLPVRVPFGFHGNWIPDA